MRVSSLLFSLTVFSLAAALLTACSASSAFADINAGKAIYAQRCVTCHGEQGAGDGPVSVNLPPAMKPRNLQTEALKYAVDLPKFKELMTKGGGAVGLNPLMPPQPDLKDLEIEGLFDFVKSLKK